MSIGSRINKNEDRNELNSLNFSFQSDNTGRSHVAGKKQNYSDLFETPVAWKPYSLAQVVGM